MLLALWACAPAPHGAPAAVEEAAAPAEPCEVTWDNFGHGFVLTYCQGCHADLTPDRHGAPPGLSFATEAEVLASRDRVLATVQGETMPPAGGVDDAAIARLATWLECAAAR